MLRHSHPELKNAQYVVFVDNSRRYVDCSEGACELLGYTRAELLKKTIDDISYDLEAVPKLFAQFVAMGTLEGQYILQSKNKVPIPIRYRAFLFSDGCKAAIWDPIKDWREPYLDALLEVDPAKLKVKLHLAQVAIRQAQSTGPQDPRDRQALGDALSAMNTLSKKIR